MTTRKYSSRSQQTTLAAGITDIATSATVVSGSALRGGADIPAGTTFTVVIDPDTALEEIVDVTAVSTNVLTIVRGVENAGTGQAHSAGAAVRHMAIGRDFREANLHIEATGAYNDGTGSHAMHGIASGEGDVVGTTKAQTLTLKTISGASNTITNIGTTALTDSSVTTAKIADSAVTSAKIADLTIATGNIADSAITSGKIATGAVGTTKIDDLSITTAKVVDSAITAAKISTDAVTTAKIQDGAVTTGKIADGTIVNADINASAAIDKTKISGTAITAGDTGTVTSAMIADATIVNTDISATAAIAKTKLDLGGTITSADLVDGTIVNADINASAAIALSKLAVDPLARANHTGTQVASTISDFDTQVRTNRLDQMAAPSASVALNAQKITGLADPTNAQEAVTLNYITTQKGANNGLASLDGTGKLPTNQLPALAISEVYVVANEAAMLALPSDIGEIAIRTDVSKSFILSATPSSTLANWKELLTPPDAVLSVDGLTGAVSLSGTYLNATTGTLLGNLAAGGFKVTGLGTPTSDNDAATKVYVDAVAGSATAAAASATAAAASYDSFDDRYLGPKSTPPTVDNDGNPLLEGALYWNSVSNAMLAWDGSAWASISSTSDIYRYRYTATGGETSKSGTDDNGLTLSYIAGKEQVYLNGVLLARTSDYNATNGTSITGLAALAAGDILEIITFTAFELVNVLSPTLFDAKGDLLAGTGADTVGKLTVGTNGQYLQADSSTATGLTWSTVSGYSAPTLGSTSIASGATVSNVNGLTINSTTIPTSKTLVDTDSSQTLTNKTLTDAKINLAFDAETASYTAVLANNSQVVTMNNASANTFSIPTNASVAFPIGTQINVLQIGAGQTTIQAVTSGTTTIQSTGAAAAAPKLRVRYSAATCVKAGTDLWYVFGDIA